MFCCYQVPIWSLTFNFWCFFCCCCCFCVNKIWVYEISPHFTQCHNFFGISVVVPVVTKLSSVQVLSVVKLLQRPLQRFTLSHVQARWSKWKRATFKPFSTLCCKFTTMVTNADKNGLGPQSFVSTGRWWTMEGRRRSLDRGEEAKFRKVHSHQSRAGPSAIGWQDIKMSVTIYYYTFPQWVTISTTVEYLWIQ